MRVPLAVGLAWLCLLSACDSPTRTLDVAHAPSVRKEFCLFDPCVVSTFEAASYVASIRITDLGALPGYTSSEAADVNDKGQIVGDSWWNGGSDPNTHAVLWNTPGQIQALTLLGPPTAASSARGINASGMITGTSVNAAGQQDAFLWNNGVVTDLTYGNKATAFYQVIGSRLNDAGTVAGWIYASDLVGDVAESLAYWPLGETVAHVPQFNKGNGEAADINSSGTIVGSFQTTTDGPDTGFTFVPGQTTITYTCGGVGIGCSTYGINDAGHTVGDIEYVSAYYGTHASFTNASVQDLGTLPPSWSGSGSSATDLDELDLVVGWSYDSTSLGTGLEAFLFGADFGMIRLPALPGGGYLGTQAIAINPHLLTDSILIVGSSPPAKSNGVHGVLWSVTLGLTPKITAWPGVWGRPFTPLIYENPAYLSNPNYDRYIEVKFAGAGNFDPTTVDLKTLQLNGVAPVYTEIKDLNGDGYQDLLMLFSMKQLMQSGGLTSRTTQLKVTGNFLKIGAPLLATSGVTICLSQRSCPTDDTVTGPT